MRPLQILKDDNGNMILSLMLSVMIVIMAVYASMSVQVHTARTQNVHQATEENILLAQYNLIAKMNSSAAWANTYKSALNVNLKRCLTDPTFNCPTGTRKLVIVDENGVTYYDSGNAAYGFNSAGTICTAYKVVPVPANSPDCLLRYDITWVPQCPATGACNTPAIVLTFNLSTNYPNGSISINPTWYVYKTRIN